MAIDTPLEIAFIDKNVNLKSYSSSKGFLGYIFFNNETNDETKVKDISDIINNLIPEFKIASSLWVWNKNEYAKIYDMNNEQYFCLESLVLKKIIQVVDSDEGPGFHFIAHADRETVEEIITIKSLLSASPHIFFLETKSSLIIYPHDDNGGGIGFICGNEKNLINNLQKVLSSLEPFVGKVVFQKSDKLL